MILRKLLAPAVVASVMLVAGCGAKDEKPAGGAPPDPYAGMSKEEKIQAIQNDPKIGSFEKQAKIDALNSEGAK